MEEVDDPVFYTNTSKSMSSIFLEEGGSGVETARELYTEGS